MIPETVALMEKAQQSLHAAQSLQSDGYFNFAASRLYYAMFYTDQALLLSRGLSYSSHAAVIAAFGKEFAKTGDLDTRFHRWLLDAQDIRNEGDYGISDEISLAQFQELVMWAESFLAAAKTSLTKV